MSKYFSILLGLVPSAASACPVCFGKTNNAGLVLGLGWGLTILITSTFGVLAFIIYGIVQMERRKAEADALIFKGKP